MWNQIGDDTAPAGSPKMPIPVSLPPFQSFPLSIRSPPHSCETNEGAGWQASNALLPTLCCSASKQPRQGRQERARVVGWCTGPPVHGVTKHQLRHNSNQFTDGGGSRHSTGLYIYETVSNKRSSNNRYDVQIFLNTSRQSKTTQRKNRHAAAYRCNFFSNTKCA